MIETLTLPGLMIDRIVIDRDEGHQTEINVCPFKDGNEACIAVRHRGGVLEDLYLRSSSTDFASLFETDDTQITVPGYMIDEVVIDQLVKSETTDGLTQLTCCMANFNWSNGQIDMVDRHDRKLGLTICLK